MRIISGIAKGIRLKAPKGMNTRPTTDRVKESVFGILSSRLVDAEVLDLFAKENQLKIPMSPLIRSFNIANSVAFVVGEARRQLSVGKI